MKHKKPLASYREKIEKVQVWIQFLAVMLAFVIRLIELGQLISSMLNH